MYCTTCNDITQHLFSASNCECQVESDTHGQSQPEVVAGLGHRHLVAAWASLRNGIQAGGSIS